MELFWGLWLLVLCNILVENFKHKSNHCQIDNSFSYFILNEWMYYNQYKNEGTLGFIIVNHDSIFI